MDLRNTEFYFDAFGRTVLHNQWSFNITPAYNIMHYVIGGKAHYIHNGIVHEFREGHFYILSGLANIKRNLIPGEYFDHMYFDFSSNKILKNDVVEIDTAEYPLLHSIAECTSQFFLESDISQPTFTEYKDNKEILGMAHNFFKILLQTANSITPLFTNIDMRISDALDYIQKNYNDADLTIQKIARHIHLSVPRFNTLFYAETKTTPYKYIMEFRLNHAYKLLSDGEPIKFVAEASGYSNIYSFSKAFKHRYSVTPGSISPYKKN